MTYRGGEDGQVTRPQAATAHLSYSDTEVCAL